MSMKRFLEDLERRGLLAEVSPDLASRLSEGPIVGYVGFDPTARSLQVGNLVPTMMLARLQRSGGKPIVIVGGGTGLIGDPSGKRTERPLLDEETVEHNVQLQRRQFERFLDFEPGTSQAEILNNAEWLKQLDLLGFLRDVGRHFNLGYMLQKDSVRTRLQDGLSYTEFSYMPLQAYDFLYLYRRWRCQLQMGGSDQWGNITAGVDLIRRVEGARTYGLTAPLLTTSSGAKFGKTESGTIWLDPDLTPPFEFYQYWINVDDRDVGRFLRSLTWVSSDDVEEIEAEHVKRPERRCAQKELARRVTSMCHGGDVVTRVEAVTALLFDREPESLTADELLMVSETAPRTDIPRDRVLREGGTSIAELMIETTLASSRTEAKRLIAAGGVYLGAMRVERPDQRATIGQLLNGDFAILRRGKKVFRVIRFTGGGGRHD